MYMAIEILIITYGGSKFEHCDSFQSKQTDMEQ